MKKANSVRELEVYQGAFALQQMIFVASKRFPKDETYSLTDQIRRASRSIGANLSEAWLRPVEE
jgi:four helix bundle protein